MNVETLPGLPLTKEQLNNILAGMSVGYIKPTDLRTTSPILPPFKKLGVLVDYDDIVEATTDSKSSTSKENKLNIKSTQAQDYSCIQCRRHLPTAHLLDLHITEQHDLYFAASVERGDKPRYSCYIEECVVKFNDPQERKDHCIKVHKFPPNYRFDQAKASKVHKCKNSSDMDVDVDNNVPLATESKLPYIKAFNFGHPTQRTFNTRKERGTGKALLDVQAMKDALNDMD
ncbi:protein lethal(2)k10201 [Drosophila grimshawi]|uniref:GH20574 n=1 Tax=Drosophila grimshawi TaxID=7222 RepID=B4J878_DROGR|nr:protein lethal(2)k10201 [Drosophila grimshawi]EDW01215.1 GH20574 [Drosophila grimshawi]